MSSQIPPDTAWMRLRSRLRNRISVAGIALSLVSLANIFLFSLIDFIAERANPYIGILAYIVAPGFLICGLLLIGAGLWHQRRQKTSSPSGNATLWPHIDLNDPTQRSVAISFGSFLLVFAMISSVGSYKAYEYTESVQFCGLSCHTAMHPEYTAYQVSSHARVGCTECHVGSGASWYLKSKWSGTRQLLGVVLNNYPRPIPTPVHNLRPAQDTCEQCHWPSKSYGSQLKVFTHYDNDEKNTLRQITLLIKTGGGDPATGAPQGIHWHMNLANQIDYVASDDKRQVIAYIHVKDMQGRVTEYYAKDSTLNKEQIAKAEHRRMDCIDCHNRPSHVFIPPDEAVDQALLARRLDISLPFIKQQAVTALTGTYPSTDAAVQGIEQGLEQFYESKYPDVAKSRQLQIRSAVNEVQQIFRRTTFPEMKSNWQTHPNNLGHLYFNGCFRCHDGQHVSPEGKTLSKDCNLCHSMIAQEAGSESLDTAPPTQSFQHPVDLGDMTQVNCSDCHTGGIGP